MSVLHRLWLQVWLRGVQRWDRWRLKRLMRRHPGLEIHPEASSNFAVSRFDLEPGARLRIGAGAVTERRREGVRFSVRSGGQLVIGEQTWLRSDLSPVLLYVFQGARMVVGRDGFLNGCHLSAKQEVELGEHCWVGSGSRVYDSDQHDLDADTRERSQPVRLGSHVWIASDVTVLRGVSIGDHTVVGTRSLVSRSLPAHTLAFGAPAVPRGSVGDRSRVSI